MTPEQGYAFDEARSAEAVRHNNVLYESLNRRFEALRGHFREHRFAVLNCTEDSGLTAFPHIPFEQAIEKASAECGKAINTKGWYTT